MIAACRETRCLTTQTLQYYVSVFSLHIYFYVHSIFWKIVKYTKYLIYPKAIQVEAITNIMYSWLTNLYMYKGSTTTYHSLVFHFCTCGTVDPCWCFEWGTNNIIVGLLCIRLAPSGSICMLSTLWAHHIFIEERLRALLAVAVVSLWCVAHFIW